MTEDMKEMEEVVGPVDRLQKESEEVQVQPM